jgi:hypothetical protein
MVKNIRPLKEKLDSAAWLNAVRNQQGTDYQNRIPEATQANLRETVENIWNYTPGRNQVSDALVNQLAMVMFTNTLWSNPLTEFKSGTLEYGETVEEVMIGLIEAIDYDFDRDELEKEIFGESPLEVQSRFYSRNRKDRYKFTLHLPGLRSALIGNQLGSYAAAAMSAPQTSDQWDEYLLMTRLFHEMDVSSNQGFHTVNVPDVSDQDSDADDSKFLLRRMREYRNTLPFISRAYNLAGMPAAVNPSDLILFTTANADAAMDVEALAAAFNIEKAEAQSRKIVLPAEHLGIDGTQAILTTRNFFRVFDNLIDTTSQFNPAKLSTNYWLHHWQTIAASPFAPVIMFNSRRESTVLNVTETATTDIGAFTFTDDDNVVEATALRRGTLYDVRVEGVTTPVGGVSALDLDVSGNTSALTYITNNGGIYVGPDENGDTLTITATAENGYTESTTRTVKGTLLVAVGGGFEIQQDADNDGLEEVTPKPLSVDANDDVTIPRIAGVQYKKAGADVAQGSVHHLTASTVFTAVAKAGKELTAGATASWTLAP